MNKNQKKLNKTANIINIFVMGLNIVFFMDLFISN